VNAGERRLRAAHEAGHALAAHILGYRVLWLELGGEACGPVTAFQRADFKPEWRLNGNHPPPPDPLGWTDAANEITVAYAGEEAERLAGDLPELSPEGAALAEAQAAIEDAPAPIPGDMPGEPWHAVPMSDAELAERLLAAITSSEHERAGLRVALRCRAQALVRSEQFQRALAHLTVVLEQSGSLAGEPLRVELERAELRASQAGEGLDEAA
jgi:hypothetical protein